MNTGHGRTLLTLVVVFLLACSVPLHGHDEKVSPADVQVSKSELILESRCRAGGPGEGHEASRVLTFTRGSHPMLSVPAIATA